MDEEWIAVVEEDEAIEFGCDIASLLICFGRHWPVIRENGASPVAGSPAVGQSKLGGCVRVQP